MSDTTKIQWCDSTHNFWRGCRVVSSGCANCYAKKQVERFGGNFAERVRSKDFNAPLRWNRQGPVCVDCGTPGRPDCECGQIGATGKTRMRRVFINSMSDIFDPEVPIEMVAEAFDVMRRCPNLHLILCTKRPELWEARVQQVNLASVLHTTPDLGLFVSSWLGGTAPKNITILASVEDQPSLEERARDLLNIPAAMHGLSIEPMLGPIFLPPVVGLDFRRENQMPRKDGAGIDWVIVGGESGPKARPMEIVWLDSIARQCTAAGVPLFVNQDSGRKPGQQGRIPNELWKRKEFPK